MCCRTMFGPSVQRAEEWAQLVQSSADVALFKDRGTSRYREAFREHLFYRYSLTLDQASGLCNQLGAYQKSSVGELVCQFEEHKAPHVLLEGWAAYQGEGRRQFIHPIFPNDIFCCRDLPTAFAGRCPGTISKPRNLNGTLPRKLEQQHAAPAL